MFSKNKCGYFNFDVVPNHLQDINECSETLFDLHVKLGYVKTAIRYLKQTEKYCETPLHLAVRHGDVEAVKSQLSGLGNVNDVNKNKVIPLHCISRMEKKKVYSLLLNNYYVNHMLKMTPLFFASRKGNIRIVQILLDHKADIDSKFNTLSPLSIAIIRRHEKVVKLLLNNGADVTIKDNIFGDTPLHIALYCKHEAIATEILGRFISTINSKSDGTTVDIENNFGETPLYVAALRGLNNFVSILLKNKANANYKTKTLFTPFQISAERLNIDTVKTFLELVDINLIINYEFEYPDGLLFSGGAIIQDVIERHIIKRKVAGIYLNKYILAHSNLYEQNPFHKECEKEIEIMMDKINHQPISFYDILLKDNVKSCYFKNRNFLGIFESGFYKFLFPIYASELERKCGPAVKRQEYLKEGSQALILLSSGVTRLPDVCSEKIVSYLNNEDLEQLINACNSS